MIRKATKEEFVTFLQDESIASRLDVCPEEAVDSNYYLVIQDDYRLIFVYHPLCKSSAEMHVAAIKAHRVKARDMISEALEFVKQKGFKHIVTWVPVIFQSTINMAKKLDFEPIFKRHHPGYRCDVIYLERTL